MSTVYAGTGSLLHLRLVRLTGIGEMMLPQKSEVHSVGALLPAIAAFPTEGA